MSGENGGNKGWLVYCLIAIAIWGVWGIISKAAEKHASSETIQVVSVIGVLPAGLALMGSKNLKKGRRIGLGCLYAFGTGICGSSGNLAMLKSFAGGGDASVVLPYTGMFPLVTVLLAVLILRERMNWIQVAGIGVALVAVYLFNGGGSEQGGAGWMRDFFQPWMRYATLALVLWGVAGVLQKLATNEISTELSTVCFAAAFVPVGVAVALIYPEKVSWTLTTAGWTFSLLFGLFIGVGTLVLFAAYRRGKASIVTALYALYPAITVLLAMPIFGESMDGRKALAIILALGAGIALSYESASGSAPAFEVVTASHVEPLDSREMI